MSPTATRPLRELAYRQSNNLQIKLYWSEQDGNLLVTVDDLLTDQRFEIDAPRHAALDVFHHPFAYLGRSAAARESIRPLAA